MDEEQRPQTKGNEPLLDVNKKQGLDIVRPPATTLQIPHVTKATKTVKKGVLISEKVENCKSLLTTDVYSAI